MKQKKKFNPPSKYTVLLIVSVIAFVLPLFILFLNISSFSNKIGLLILTAIGCISIGVGLFVILFPSTKKKRGYLPSIIALALGSYLVGIAIYAINNSSAYDPAVLSFYFISLLMMFISAIFYVCFRSEFGKWLKKSRCISK